MIYVLFCKFKPTCTRTYIYTHTYMYEEFNNLIERCGKTKSKSRKFGATNDFPTVFCPIVKLDHVKENCLMELSSALLDTLRFSNNTMCFIDVSLFSVCAFAFPLFISFPSFPFSFFARSTNVNTRLYTCVCCACVPRNFFFSFPLMRNTSRTCRNGLNEKTVPFEWNQWICAVLVDDKNEESNSRVIHMSNTFENCKPETMTRSYAMLFLFFCFSFPSFFSFFSFFSFLPSTFPFPFLFLFRWLKKPAPTRIDDRRTSQWLLRLEINSLSDFSNLSRRSKGFKRLNDWIIFTFADSRERAFSAGVLKNLASIERTRLYSSTRPSSILHFHQRWL